MSADGPRQKLNRIVERTVDDLWVVSDEELLAEFHESGEDPISAASEVARELEAAVRAAGKVRLQQARSQFNAVYALRRTPSVTGLSMPEKERILQSFAANDRPLQQRLTLAARNGQGMTEAEVDSVLLDLVELGALDNDGKPR